MTTEQNTAHTRKKQSGELTGEVVQNLMKMAEQLRKRGIFVGGQLKAYTSRNPPKPKFKSIQ